MTRASQLPK